MYKKQKGFSLIELMVVIAIIAILATIAIPTYRHYILRAKIGTVLPVLERLKSKTTEHFVLFGAFPTGTAGFQAMGMNSSDFESDNIASIELSVAGDCAVSGNTNAPSTTDAKCIVADISPLVPNAKILLSSEFDAATEVIYWRCHSNLKQIFIPGECTQGNLTP